MQVINYFESDRKEHWLEQIKKYGFAFLEEAQSIYGEVSRVYEKKIEVR